MIKFITLEGGEGCGKTTVANKLTEELQKFGFKVLCTREPGGVELSEKIRSLLLGNYMTPEAEALLFAASRAELVNEKIKPAIENDYIVICDRYIDSSLVYQGYVRNLGISHIYDINMFATNHLLPDLTLYLDLPVEIAMQRVNNRHEDKNRFDKEDLKFYDKVRSGFKVITSMYGRIVEIDASKPLDEVVSNCIEVVLQRGEII